jgi:hypothetical protein
VTGAIHNTFAEEYSILGYNAMLLGNCYWHTGVVKEEYLLICA